MKRLFFFLLFALFLSGAFASCYAPTFSPQALKVESDSCFYGSSTGQVVVDVNVESLSLLSKEVYLKIVGLEKYTSVSLSSIKLTDDSKSTKTVKTKLKPLESDDKIKFDSFKKYQMQLVIDFNVDEVGIGQEFDIQFVDEFGFLVADLDPFLSGWDYRQEWTMNTNGIGLSGNVTNDHVIPFFIGSGNTNFWANTQNDGDDVRFTDSSNNLFNFHFETWVDDTNMLAWVGITETFDSTTDITGYIYYGNASATSGQNESGTYPATYIAVYHLDNASDSTGVYDGSVAGATTEPNSKLNGGYDFSDSGDTITTADFDITDTFTFIGWINTLETGEEYRGIFAQRGAGSLNGLIYTSETKLSGYIGSTAVTKTVSAMNGAWKQIAMTYNGSSVELFIDSISQGTGARTGNVGTTASFKLGLDDVDSARNIGGDLDEWKVFKSVLTSDEIKLLYNAENNPSTFVVFGSQESGVISPVWNEFKIVDYINKGEIDLNVSTNTRINLDVNLTLASFNVNDVNTYYQVRNDFDDTNTFRWIRNTSYSGFLENVGGYSTVSSSGDTYYIRSGNLTDGFFKYSMYNVTPSSYESLDGNFVFNSPNDWVKMFFNNVRMTGVSDSNMLVEYMFGGSFIGATNRNLMLYDCNYDSINPVGDPSCFSFTVTPDDPIERDGYRQITYSTNDANTFEGVKLNEDGNHFVYVNCPNCTPSQYWNLSYIDENTNIDRTRNYESGTGVGNLLASTKTFNAHFHVNSFLVDSNFEYYLTVTDNNSVYTSPIQSDEIEIVNLPPVLNSFDFPLQNTVYSGLVDVNVMVEDPNNDSLTCDLNINQGATSYSIATDVSVINNSCGYNFDSAVYEDGYYFVSVAIKEVGTTELFIVTEIADYNFFIDNNSPTIIVVSPNGNEYYTGVATIQIDFNATDSYSPLTVDLNYSDSNVQGTGTPVLIGESIEGVNIICSGVECSYTWNIGGVPDGNYYILIALSDALYTSFDASDSDFNIYTTVVPTPDTNSSYSRQYVNPNSDRRDGNIYYSTNSTRGLTDEERTRIATEQMQTLIFIFGVIIILVLLIIGVVLWKRN